MPLLEKMVEERKKRTRIGTGEKKSLCTAENCTEILIPKRLCSDIS